VSRASRRGGVIAVAPDRDVALGREADGGGGLWIAISVLVVVQVLGFNVDGVVTIDGLVAVIVDAVADLDVAGEGGGELVVAIIGVVCVSLGLIAGDDGFLFGVTERVIVEVDEPDARIESVVFIDLTIAVIVEAVAEFLVFAVSVSAAAAARAATRETIVVIWAAGVVLLDVATNESAQQPRPHPSRHALILRLRSLTLLLLYS